MSNFLGYVLKKGVKGVFTKLTGVGQTTPGRLERFRRYGGRPTRVGESRGNLFKDPENHPRNIKGQRIHVAENVLRTGISGTGLAIAGGMVSRGLSGPSPSSSSNGNPTLTQNMVDKNGVALEGAPSKEEQKAAQKAADERIKARAAFRQKVSAGSHTLPSSLFKTRMKESQWAFTAGEKMGTGKYMSARDEITKAYAAKDYEALARASAQMHADLIGGVGHDPETVKNIGKGPYMLPGIVKDRKKRSYAMFLVPDDKGGWTTEFLQTDYQHKLPNQEEGSEDNGQP